MKPKNEKERNERIDKLINVVTRFGVSEGKKDLEDCLSDENWLNRDQTEDDYQREQAAWLKKVAEARQQKKSRPLSKKTTGSERSNQKK